jgi:hypothetical protein
MNRIKPSDYFLVAVVAFLGCVVIFGSQLLGFKIIAGPDYFNYWIPLYENSLINWRDGSGITIWLRQLHGGIPLIASMNSMDFYPTQLMGIILGVPSRIFFSWDATLHIVISALGCSFMLTSMGVGRYGSILGGLFYAFSGLTVTTLRFGVHPMIRAAAFLPWIAGNVIRSFNNVKASVVYGGICVSLMIFSDAIQVVVFGAIWCGVIGIFHSGTIKGWYRLSNLVGIFGLGRVTPEV